MIVKKHIKQVLIFIFSIILSGNVILFFFPEYLINIFQKNIELHETKIPEITLDSIILKKIKKPLFIDAREEYKYKLQHIEDAISIPISTWVKSISSHLKELILAENIVVYCGAEECSASTIIAQKLRFLGFQNVYILKDDFKKLISYEKESSL